MPSGTHPHGTAELVQGKSSEKWPWPSLPRARIAPKLCRVRPRPCLHAAAWGRVSAIVCAPGSTLSRAVQLGRLSWLAGGLQRAAEDPPWCRRRSDSSFRVDADDAVQQGLEHICEQQSGSGRGSWGHLGGGSVLGIRQGGGRIAVDHGSQWCQALRMMRLHAAGMPLAEYERRGRTAYQSAGRWKGSRTRFSRLP